MYDRNMMRLVFMTGLAAIAASLMPTPVTAHATAQLHQSGQIISHYSGGDNPGALYEAGSISKFACTVAVLRLVDRGALDLDQPVAEILPDTASLPVASVALRHLLANRSGLSDGLSPAVRTDPVAVMATPDARSAVMRYADGPLAAEQGTAWSYDLVNWVVVQAIIERAGNAPLADVLRDLVLHPAGMGQSHIFVGEIGAAAQPPEGQTRPLPGFLSCAGGLATTPADLIALVRFAHKGGLQANSLAELMQVTTQEENYTLGGRFITDEAGRILSWQSGSNGPYKSLVAYDPTTDIGIAAMSASGSKVSIEAVRAEWMASRRPR